MRIRRTWLGAPAWLWLLALAPRLATIFVYGPHLTIHSDDEGYYRSALWLLQKGTFSYYTPDAPTVHMMPGITLLLAGILWVFGTGTVGLYAGKIVFTLIATLGIAGIYRAVSRISRPWVGAVVAAAIALYPPEVLVDTLFLTEPLFMAAFAWLFDFTFKVAESRRLRDVLGLAVLFMLAIYVRPNVALWVVLALIYFLMKGYPRPLFWRHLGAAVVVGLIFMVPWWIRNEMVFHRWILFTDDSWNPLLLGTFEGYGYPPPSNEGAIEHQLLREYPSLRPQSMHELTWFHLQKQIAFKRMGEWLKTNPSSFWTTYLWLKPQILWLRAYLPIPIFGITEASLRGLQTWVVDASIIGHFVAMVFARGRRRELLLVWLTLLYYTALFSFFFAFERYNVPIDWLMFSGVPLAVWALLRAIVGEERKRGRAKSGRGRSRRRAAR
ncbi:ArnT family glycosyltransferase [Alicyclobacillus acidocaldarius]|nr:glycosyltransferase family 39 protein [Alicyclobacillus acidocaldarius]